MGHEQPRHLEIEICHLGSEDLESVPGRGQAVVAVEGNGG